MKTSYSRLPLPGAFGTVGAVSASLAGLLGCGLAQAESAAEAALPTVVVTATAGGGTAEDGYRARQSGVAGFSDQDLLDTPLSVKVLPSQLLANLKIDTIAGIDRLDASVGSAAANPGWFSAPTIRGFTLDNNSNYRYNGLTMINQQATALENKERVEILKGPSALQAGFSAPGGIIQYVTKRPTAADSTALHLSANEFGNYKVHADLSRRSADGRHGLRVNAAVEDERTCAAWTASAASCRWPPTCACRPTPSCSSTWNMKSATRTASPTWSASAASCRRASTRAPSSARSGRATPPPSIC